MDQHQLVCSSPLLGVGWGCLRGGEGDLREEEVLQTLGAFLSASVKVPAQRLPWWLSGEESTGQSRRRGFHPWTRKIPHASEQLNLCTATIKSVLKNPRVAITEPTCHNYRNPCALESVLCNEKPLQWEACAPHLESSPYSRQVEKSPWGRKTQHSQK